MLNQISIWHVCFINIYKFLGSEVMIERNIPYPMADEAPGHHTGEAAQATKSSEGA